MVPDNPECRQRQGWQRRRLGGLPSNSADDGGAIQVGLESRKAVAGVNLSRQPRLALTAAATRDAAEAASSCSHTRTTTQPDLSSSALNSAPVLAVRSA